MKPPFLRHLHEVGAVVVPGEGVARQLGAVRVLDVHGRLHQVGHDVVAAKRILFQHSV